jgi:hypothetical protein
VRLDRADASLLDAERYALASAGTTTPAGTTAPAGPADASRTLAAATDGSPEGPGGWRPLTWILLVAVALLGAEWALVQRGRMP